MSDLRTAAQQALEFLDAEFGWSPGEAPRIDALRAALAQQAEPAQKQDAELSAALGWPGGISNPVLDRKVLLQKVAALRLASQQALEALEAMNPYPASKEDQRAGALTALRAALAQEQAGQEQVTYSTGGLHLEAGFYSEVDLRRMLKALESMNAAARRAMEETK